LANVYFDGAEVLEGGVGRAGWVAANLVPKFIPQMGSTHCPNDNC